MTETAAPQGDQQPASTDSPLPADAPQAADAAAASDNPPAPADDPKPPKPTVHDARNAIFERAREVREAQIAQTDPARLAANAHLAGRQVEQADAHDQTSSDEALALNGKTRTLKVNGQDIEVSETEVIEAGIKTLQKQTAADLKLQRASAAEALAAQRLAEATEKLRQAERGASDLPSGDPSGVRIDSIASEAIGKAQTALFDGDTDKARAALADATRKMSQATAREQVIAEVNEAFLTDFPDIAANPTAFARAVMLMRGELAKNPKTASIPGLAARIGNQITVEMLSALDQVRPPQGQGPSTDSLPESRREIKARLPAMPSGSSARTADSRPKEIPRMSASEIVKQMRRARGQLVAD